MGRAPCCDKANVKRGPWSPEEDSKLKSYIDENGTGGNWIALPQKIGLKRCGKSCRLRWLNYLRPNIKHGGFSEEEDNIICNLYISIGSRWSIIAAQLPGRTDNDIKNYWNTRLKKKLLGKQRKEHQSRRVNAHLKQEMMKKAGNDVHFMMNNTAADNNNKMNGSTHQNHPQSLYFPQPVPTAAPQLDSALNDHTSIRKLLIKLGGRFSDIQDHHLQQGVLDNNKLKNISFYTPSQDIPSTQQVYGGHDPHTSSMDWFSSSMNYSTINTNNGSSCADELLLNNSYDIVDDDGINMHEMLVSDDGLNGCFPIDHEHLGDDDHSMPPLCRNTKMESSSVIDHYDQAGSSSTELLYGSSSMAMENESSSSTPGTHIIDITKPSSSGGNGNSWVHVDRHMRPFMYPNTIPTVTTTTGFGSSPQQQPPPQQQRVLQNYGLN